jgi:putative sigma-54 modulation protein
MKVTVQSVKFNADRKLLDFVEGKVGKLANRFDNIVGSEVILKLDKSNSLDNKVAEIKLIIPGNDLFAKKNSKSFEEATDTAIDALLKQLQRHKGKLRNN